MNHFNVFTSEPHDLVYAGMLPIIWPNDERVHQRATDWTVYYHTSRRLWYPRPKETVSLSPVPNGNNTLACRWNAASWLRPYAKLGVLLWSCGEATHDTARNNYGKTWHSIRVYLPETVCGIRPASNFKHHCQRTNWRSCRKQQAPLERKRMTRKSPMSSITAATKSLAWSRRCWAR